MATLAWLRPEGGSAVAATQPLRRSPPPSLTLGARATWHPTTRIRGDAWTALSSKHILNA